MSKIICLDQNYSTTKLLTKEKAILKQHNDDQFKTILFLSEGENRKGEGGLRTKGYFKKSYEDKPLISIITVVFNGEKYLEQTIKSVIYQTYENIEYIIIDGGSTDGTLDIIKKYENQISYWVSENDDGISDAFNKGIKLTKGIYINFQGDGDGFCSIDVLENIFSDINTQEDIFVSARIQRIDENGKELYISKHIDHFDKRSLLFRMSMPHQGLFTHKSYFEKYGLFDLNNTFCMDYEHLLRSYKEFPKVIMKDVIVAKWRADGLGTGRTLEILKEYDKIKRDNNIASVFVLNGIKYWILIKYYVKVMLKG